MDDTTAVVSVNIPATASVAKNGTVTLTASKTPADASVTWSSSDTTIATVTSGGVVSGVLEGTAVIVAKATKSGSEAIATCVLTVTAEQGEG